MIEHDIVEQAIEYKHWHSKFLSLCEKEGKERNSEEKKKLSEMISDSSNRSIEARAKLFKLLDKYGTEKKIKQIKEGAE